MPSSQVIYGIVVMFTLNRPVTAEVAPGLFAIGVLAGLAPQKGRYCTGFLS